MVMFLFKKKNYTTAYINKHFFFLFKLEFIQRFVIYNFPVHSSHKNQNYKLIMY